MLILVGSLFGYLPITAVQILWVNLVTDSGPALALAVDPAAPGLMRQPPRRGPIISRSMLALAGGVGVVLSVTTLGVFFIGLSLFDLQTAQTMTFTALVAKEYLAVVVIRRYEGASLLANRWLLVAVAVSLSLQVALLYTPIGTLFGTVPLDPVAWAVIGGALMVALPVALVVTGLVRRRYGPL
jgi:Ca2+-transporting ATPase